VRPHNFFFFQLLCTHTHTHTQTYTWVTALAHTTTRVKKYILLCFDSVRFILEYHSMSVSLYLTQTLWCKRQFVYTKLYTFNTHRCSNIISCVKVLYLLFVTLAVEPGVCQQAFQELFPSLQFINKLKLATVLNNEILHWH